MVCKGIQPQGRDCSLCLIWILFSLYFSECHHSCWLCTGPSADNCTSCPSPSSLHEGRCVPSCLQGFFIQDNQCQGENTHTHFCILACEHTHLLCAFPGPQHDLDLKTKLSFCSVRKWGLDRMSSLDFMSCLPCLMSSFSRSELVPTKPAIEWHTPTDFTV